MAEIFDLYDKDRIRTNETVPRGDTIPEGRYHQVVHICIFNKAGQMLIQQRQPFKQGWPDLWDISVGGSVIAGEDSRQGAHRELKEELGIDYDFSDLRPQLTINFNHGFDDYYIIGMELDPDKLNLQYEEVRQARWAERSEIQAMIHEKIFLPYYPELIDFLFASRFHFSAHSV